MIEFEPTLTVIGICVVLFFLAGFIDAIAGGGGLITIPSLLLVGLPAHYALGTSKFSSAIGTLTALASYIRNNCVVLKIAPVGFVTAFLGSMFGSWLALQIDSAALGRILVFLLPVGMAISLASGSLKLTEEELPSRFLWLRVIVVGFSIGLYDGFFGPATGSFFLIALHLALRMNLVKASATAKVFNLASNLGGFSAFAAFGTVSYAVGIPCAVASVIGNQLGVRCALRVGARLVRTALYAVLMLLLMTLVYRFFIA